MHFFPEREAVRGANGLLSSLVEGLRTDVVDYTFTTCNS
jgi:hypothetical protein